MEWTQQIINFRVAEWRYCTCVVCQKNIALYLTETRPKTDNSWITRQPCECGRKCKSMIWTSEQRCDMEIKNSKTLKCFFDECLTMHRRWHGENKTNSMLHNGLLDLMNRSTCFGHYLTTTPARLIQLLHLYSEEPYAETICIVVSSWWWA